MRIWSGSVAFEPCSQARFDGVSPAKYIDVLERTLYSGFLSGVSLSGIEFFYVNPLAWDGEPNDRGTVRKEWFGCSCCPSNVVRFMPAVPSYLYAKSGNDVYINLFAESEATVTVKGTKVGLTQTTDYPWNGDVTIDVTPENSVECALRIRIPGWAQNEPMPGDLYSYETNSDDAIELTVNGEAVTLELDKGYAVISRIWATGDQIKLSLPMPIRRVLCHDAVESNRGLAALERGPLVYCVEDDLDGVTVPQEDQLSAETRDDLLGGVTALTDGDGFEAIPYYARAHRGSKPFAVWLPAK